MIRYGQYGRKECWIVKRYEKYGRKISWIVKRSGKYRRKLWNDMENTEEKWVVVMVANFCKKCNYWNKKCNYENKIAGKGQITSERASS